MSGGERPARAPDLPFAAVSFGYFAYAGLFGTYAPLWFQSLGYTTFAIGALTSMQAATRLFAPYLWGWVADHTGLRERLLRIAVAGALVFSIGFFVGADYRWIAAVSVALFVCTAGIIPISESLLAYRVSRNGKLDVARYGRVRMWGSVGFIAAVTASGFILEAAGVRSFPVLVTLLLGLLLVAATRLPVANEKLSTEDSPTGALSVLRQPVVAWFFAGVFLTVLGHMSLYAFYSLYLASLGYDKGAIGLLWAIGVAVELGWFFFQGRWTHLLPMHAWLLVAALASAVRFGTIAAFGSVAVALVAAQCLHALSFAAQHSACIAVISRHFPGRLRGRGQALYAVLGYGFSGVIGGVAGGWLSEALGFAAVFWAGTAAAVLAAGCCWRAMRLERTERSAQRS